jgi:hypothetical protein
MKSLSNYLVESFNKTNPMLSDIYKSPYLDGKLKATDKKTWLKELDELWASKPRNVKPIAIPGLDIDSAYCGIAGWYLNHPRSFAENGASAYEDDFKKTFPDLAEAGVTIFAQGTGYILIKYQGSVNQSIYISFKSETTPITSPKSNSILSDDPDMVDLNYKLGRAFFGAVDPHPTLHVDEYKAYQAEQTAFFSKSRNDWPAHVKAIYDGKRPQAAGNYNFGAYIADFIYSLSPRMEADDVYAKFKELFPETVITSIKIYVRRKSMTYNFYKSGSDTSLYGVDMNYDQPLAKIAPNQIKK